MRKATSTKTQRLARVGSKVQHRPTCPHLGHEVRFRVLPKRTPYARDSISIDPNAVSGVNSIFRRVLEKCNNFFFIISDQ